MLARCLRRAHSESTPRLLAETAYHRPQAAATAEYKRLIRLVARTFYGEVIPPPDLTVKKPKARSALRRAQVTAGLSRRLLRRVSDLLLPRHKACARD